MTTSNRCLIILASRRSGSTALQNELTETGQARHCLWTRHFEHETLYWVKAAALLGLEQTEMSDSELPISRANARRDLEVFLRRNLHSTIGLPQDDRKRVFEGWRRLCETFEPVFVEKSPHHLLQRSALELIEECIDRLSDVEFLLVGLVRNPMAVVYSSWRAWCGSPEKTEQEWLRSYRNLLELRGKPGMDRRLVILRYEDLVTDSGSLSEVYEFIGAPDVGTGGLHARSLARWRSDRHFGFQLSHEVEAFANTVFGYAPEEMANEGSRTWPIYRRAARLFYLFVKRPFRLLRGRLTGRMSRR